MNERIIPGAIVNPKDADLTGTPDNRVNLLERFMVMSQSESIDLGDDNMTVEKAKLMLLGGLTLNLEDITDSPKLQSLVEERYDVAQTKRKLAEEPTARMIMALSKLDPNYRREMTRLRELSGADESDHYERAPEDIHSALESSFKVFDSQEFKDEWAKLEDLEQRSNPGVY